MFLMGFISFLPDYFLLNFKNINIYNAFDAYKNPAGTTENPLIGGFFYNLNPKFNPK